jgi:hypothetical protein
MGELWMGMCSSEWYLERSGHKIVFNYDNDLPIDTVACKNVRIKGMVVLNGHIVKVVNIILICSPVVIHLSIRGSSLHGTTAHVGKELLAAVLPVTEKVVFLIGINSHPGRIVPSMSTVILGEVGEVVIVHGERTAMPGFILGLGVHSLHVGGTICLVWVPLLAAILIPQEEVIFLKSLVCHPFLIVVTPDTVQLVDEVGEPTSLVSSLGTPMMLVVGTLTLNLFRGKGTAPGLSAREVDGPGKRIMLLL